MSVTVDKTMIYRKLLNNAEFYLRDAENTFLKHVKKLDDDVQHFTCLLEDTVSPNSTSPDSEQILPVPKPLANKIHTIIKALKDDVCAFKMFETILRSDLNEMKNSVLEFSVNSNGNLSEDDKNEFYSSPFTFGYSNENPDLVYVQQASRIFVDDIRKTSQHAEDGLKDKIRSLENSAWKFVRMIEDTVEAMKKSQSLYWKETDKSELDTILKISYSLKRLIGGRTKSLNSELRSALDDVETAIESAVSARLSDGSSVIETIKLVAAK